MSLDGVLTYWHSSKQGNEVVIVNFSLGNMYILHMWARVDMQSPRGHTNHMITRFSCSIHFLSLSKSKQTHQNIVCAAAGVVTLYNKVMRVGKDIFSEPLMEFDKNIF